VVPWGKGETALSTGLVVLPKLLPLGLLSALFVGGGCTGQVSVPDDSSTPTEAVLEGARGAEAKPREGAAGESSGCSASGVTTSCDPLQLTGCSSGSCYLVGSGTGCVCPAGTVTSGGSCTVTRNCLPGYVCAGSQAPGTCRPLCDPSASKCTGSTTCTVIQTVTQYGYCEPTD
jgi:hypothetical protein